MISQRGICSIVILELQSAFSAEAAPAEFGVWRGLLHWTSRTTAEPFDPRKAGGFPTWSVVMRIFNPPPGEILG
jgi:hypothetical protein